MRVYMRANSRRVGKRAREPEREASMFKHIPVWPFYILFVVFAAMYIVFRYTGPILFVTLILIIAVEVINSLKRSTWKRNLLELSAIVIAVALIWVALIAATGSTAPVDVVPSCSMLPTLHIGDLILIRNSGIDSIKATVVNITKPQLESFLNQVSTGAYECVAFSPSNPSNISQYVLPGYSVGLYSYSYSTGRAELNPSQNGDTVRFNCGTAEIRYSNGTTAYEAYTRSITVNNETINGSMNNSIVVYKTVPSDLFYRDGDAYIVHRAYAILNASGEYYILTKGDNNPGLDVQYNNIPPNYSQVEGRVILTIPYIGYVKILLDGSSSGAGCNQVFVNG